VPGQLIPEVQGNSRQAIWFWIQPLLVALRGHAFRAGSGQLAGGMAGCSPKKRMNSALASGPRASV